MLLWVENILIDENGGTGFQTKGDTDEAFLQATNLLKPEIRTQGLAGYLYYRKSTVSQKNGYVLICHKEKQ